MMLPAHCVRHAYMTCSGAVQKSTASDNPGVLWAEPRNRLKTLLIGLEDRLPKCALIVNQGTALQALYLIPDARIELEVELRQLSAT
jgi:hypothetical protein